MTKQKENTSKSILISIHDKIAHEYGMITETRNIDTANRIYDEFIKNSKLNPEEFEIIILGDVKRIVYEENDQITKTEIFIITKEVK